MPDYSSSFDEVIDAPKQKSGKCKADGSAREHDNRANGHAVERGKAGVQIGDFVAYMPQHTYIFRPTGQMWPERSVNARIPTVRLGRKRVAPSRWLDAESPVEQMTWAPGEPALIKDRVISEGGWIARPGCTVFNLYRPPIIVPRTGCVDPWLNHAQRVFGDDGDHIVKWLAHRVQHPNDKINHALVLGGGQGIGKDTLLEPVKRAIGPWNFTEISPLQMLGRFNAFLKSVILRVSEARDLGDVDRFAFYDHLKAYTAAPPDVLRVDEKHIREYSVINVVGVVITTNHVTDGIYLPADDRRHFVAWSDLTKEDFPDGYWVRLYRWFDDGGNEIVAGYLAGLDLSGFNAKAPPPKTSAFWRIVDASRVPEDAELDDVLDEIGRPNVTTLRSLASRAQPDFAEWLRDRRNARKVPYRLESCGYIAVRNPDARDGLWRVHGQRQVIYAKQGVPFAEQINSAVKLSSQ